MALFSYPVCTWLCQYVNMGVRKWLEKSAEKQKYKMRKTANPLSRKAFRAVSFSATKDTSEQSELCSDVFYVYGQKTLSARFHTFPPWLILRGTTFSTASAGRQDKVLSPCFFILAVHPYVGAPHLYPVRYRFIRRGRPKCSATRSTDTYSPRVPAGSRASTTIPPALFTIS